MSGGEAFLPTTRRGSEASGSLLSVAFVAVFCWLTLASVPMAHAQDGAGGKARTSPDPLLVNLTERAAKLRTVGVIDSHRISEFFAFREPLGRRAAFQMSVPQVQDPEALKVLWSYFFRGAQVFLGRLKSPNPVVGYYNTIVDSWLLTIWDDEAQDPAMVASAVVPGEAVREARYGDVEKSPLWIRNLPEVTLIRALQAQGAAAVTAFPRRHPEQAAEPPDIGALEKAGNAFRPLFLQRLFTFLETATAAREGEGIGQVQKDFLDALERGDAKALMTLLPSSARRTQVAEMTNLPDSLRRGVQPLLMLHHGEEAVILSASPTQARYALVSRIRVSGTAAELVDVGGVDLYAELP